MCSNLLRTIYSEIVKYIVLTVRSKCSSHYIILKVFCCRLKTIEPTLSGFLDLDCVDTTHMQKPAKNHWQLLSINFRDTFQINKM